ncbi:hypothetical protein BKA64DRAFT_429447 [Cadophora sp. MPI-SDFR-AT-0126]|nr:hypothetical protein BKA64DRAFT_429447 [Leotiomycetes sp. MPI-SDFR-AT-0126]
MPLVNIASLKQSREDRERSVDLLDSRRGKFPRLATPSPTISENRSSLRGLPKTADISWGAYQKIPERDKNQDNQDAEGRNCLFRVTKRPTYYQESNEQFEILGDFSSFKEAREFIQHHLLTLEDENTLFLTQKTKLKPESEDDQTLLRVFGPKWDISMVAHRIWDEAIDMGNQPDAIERSQRMFYSDQQALKEEESSKSSEVVQADPVEDRPPRVPPKRSCVTEWPLDVANEAATTNFVPVSTKRSSKENGNPSTGPAANRQEIFLTLPEPSIRDAAKAKAEGVGDVGEAHQAPLAPLSALSQAELADEALSGPSSVYVVKETSFESFKARDEKIVGLFTTLADAIKEVRACWEVCTDRKYSNVEYLDGYHEDGRLWWTCRDDEGNGYDVDIELNIVKTPGSEAVYHSQGAVQKHDLVGEEIEAKFYESDSGRG